MIGCGARRALLLDNRLAAIFPTAFVGGAVQASRTGMRTRLIAAQIAVLILRREAPEHEGDGEQRNGRAHTQKLPSTTALKLLRPIEGTTATCWARLRSCRPTKNSAPPATTTAAP